MVILKEKQLGSGFKDEKMIKEEQLHKYQINKNL